MFYICPTICSISNLMMNDTMTGRIRFFPVLKRIPLLCIYNIFISYSRQMDLRSNSRRVISYVMFKLFHAIYTSV
jgi:hypothetical protein